MIFNETSLKGSYVIELEPLVDERGWFARTFCKDEFSKIGHNKEWLQLNHSYTQQQGVIRGMHYQMPPFSEIKLVRCIAGSVYDVIIDLRKGSSTFLDYFGVELSAENRKMIYIPEGFAHGFQTLTSDSEVIYHHTAMYIPAAEGGIRYNESLININWALPPANISMRDNTHPELHANFKGL
ncbi:MAG: dTDP-4-dehydrorhamnose 3,5-epimerase [Ginsengibacter sp.]